MLRRVDSRLDSWIIILSTVVYEICLIELDTVLVFGNYLGVFGDQPRNAEDNLCTGLVVIEAWFKGYLGRFGG